MPSAIARINLREKFPHLSSKSLVRGERDDLCILRPSPYFCVHLSLVRSIITIMT